MFNSSVADNPVCSKCRGSVVGIYGGYNCLDCGKRFERQPIPDTFMHIYQEETSNNLP